MEMKGMPPEGGRSKTEQEFEMLVNVELALRHINYAIDWNPHPEMQNTYDLRGARALLESVRERCSEENQRLADGHVNG
jgi:hypothetical protein